LLSVANVRTAGGATNYFAADNYFTRADADRSGQRVGKGAEILGLDGRVDANQFEAILKGLLPDGSRVGSEGRDHRAGTDLTFSMPKSWSLIALLRVIYPPNSCSLVPEAIASTSSISM
jgi:conjugative relaxase-like TrwC/TraI family protein